MRRKNKKINTKGSTSRCPPKAKVVRSNRAGCTTLPLPGRGQVVEIPRGYEVVERIAFDDFEPKRILLIRQTDPILFDIYLKSRRGGNRASRSA
jgi:hypothetical protein